MAFTVMTLQSLERLNTSPQTHPYHLIASQINNKLLFLVLQITYKKPFEQHSNFYLQLSNSILHKATFELAFPMATQRKKA